MPSHTAKPDAEHIIRFAERMEKKWSSQKTLDDILLAYYLMGNELDTASSSDGKEKKPFRSGIIGQLQKEDAALLGMNPGLHVMPVDPEDIDDKRHVNDLLEPWLVGVWHESQVEPVWSRGPLDLIVFRRFWSNVYPHPKLWANDEYQEMVERMVRAKEDKDAEKIASIRKEIREFRRDILPIRWRYVSPRNTWSAHNGEIALPEVIEIRKMTKQEIAYAFGEKAVPGDYRDSKHGDSTPIDVYEWANHQWCATVIGSKDDPKTVRKFEHALGVNPYVLIEAELLPENEKGLRWGGAAFHAQNMIDTFDELLTEYRNLVREYTRSPIIISHDPNFENPTELTGGRPTPIRYEPGVQLDIWTTESISRGEVPALNPEAYQFLQEVKQLIERTQIRPVQRGQILSGQSNNAFTTAAQMSEREFDPITQAQAKGAKEICKRFFRCVISLNKDYEDSEIDKVAIFDNFKGKGLLEVGPKDVRGRERAIQPRMERAVPLNRNIQVQVAQAEKTLGVSNETILTELGYANPAHERRLARREMLEDQTFQLMAQETAKRAGQLLQQVGPEDLAQAQEMFAGASPDLQEFLGQAVPGTFLQGAANIRRTGTFQNPQQDAVPIGNGAMM